MGQRPQRSKLRQDQKQMIIEGAQLSAFPFPPRDLLTLSVDREAEMPGRTERKITLEGLQQSPEAREAKTSIQVSPASKDAKLRSHREGRFKDWHFIYHQFSPKTFVY